MDTARSLVQMLTSFRRPYSPTRRRHDPPSQNEFRFRQDEGVLRALHALTHCNHTEAAGLICRSTPLSRADTGLSIVDTCLELAKSRLPPYLEAISSH